MNVLKSKKNPKPRINYREKLLKKLEKLDIKGTLEDLVVTFVFRDGTKKQQSVNKEFFYDSKGRVKTNNSILQDLNAIRWDYGALYYTF